MVPGTENGTCSFFLGENVEERNQSCSAKICFGLKGSQIQAVGIAHRPHRDANLDDNFESALVFKRV
jgi:hypothetical protein